MDTIAYSSIRKDIVTIMERVCNEHNPIIITHKNSKPVVMMSLEDYKAIEETIYLLSSPANAKQLRASIAEFESGSYQVRDIIDDDSVDRPSVE